MTTKMKNKIDELKKEIEELQEMIMDKNPRFLDEPQKYRCYLEIKKEKLQSYKEAQNYLNEIIQQYNQDYINKKETEKNIIDDLDKKVNTTIFDKIFSFTDIYKIIQKHYSVRVKGRAANASQSTSNKRDTGNPDNQIPPSQTKPTNCDVEMMREAVYTTKKVVCLNC